MSGLGVRARSCQRHPNPALKFSKDCSQSVKTSRPQALNRRTFLDNTFLINVDLVYSCFMSSSALACSSDDTNLGAAMHTTPWPRNVV